MFFKNSLKHKGKCQKERLMIFKPMRLHKAATGIADFFFRKRKEIIPFLNISRTTVGELRG